MKSVDKILNFAEFFQKIADKKTKKQPAKKEPVKKSPSKKEPDFITSYPKPRPVQMVKVTLPKKKQEAPLASTQKKQNQEASIKPTSDYNSLADQLKKKRDSDGDSVMAKGRYITGFSPGQQVPAYIFDPNGKVKTPLFQWDKPALLIRFLNKIENQKYYNDENARVERVRTLLGGSVNNYDIESKEPTEVEFGLSNGDYSLVVAVTLKE